MFPAGGRPCNAGLPSRRWYQMARLLHCPHDGQYNGGRRRGRRSGTDRSTLSLHGLGQQHHLRGHPVAELLPPAERHDAVAGAGALSHPQGLLRPELRPGRPDHAGFPVHGLDAAAAGRPLHRQEAPALFPDGRHGLHPGRPADDVAGQLLSPDPVRRGPDRHGLLGVPSRGLARGAHGGRRSLRPGAVAVPGRRQHGLGGRAAARRLHRRAARPAEHRVVLRRRPDRHVRAVPGRRLVQAAARARKSPRCAARPRPPRRRHCRGRA